MRNDSRRKGGFLKLFLSAVVFCGMMGTLSAQQINLSMKNVTVQEAVAALNQSANYSVILNADEVDMARRVNVDAKNASIREVLDQVFAGQDVTYVIEGNRISVAKRQQPQQSVAKQADGTVKGKNTHDHNKCAEDIDQRCSRIPLLCQHAKQQIPGCRSKIQQSSSPGAKEQVL